MLLFMNIDSRDISVVVQGPIAGALDDAPSSRHTYLCLQSIRQYLPDAEIILSTWKGQNVAGLDFDQLVESDDPGGYIFHKTEKYYNNINRQILSTKNGLLKADRKYSIKIRSDMVITSLGFLDYFDIYNNRDDEYSLLDKKVVVPTVYSRNPKRVFPFSFHPSDWFFFGLSKDVCNIWDVELADEPNMSRWFENNPRPKPDPYPSFLNRYFPEQYLWTSFLKKKLKIDFDYFCQVNRGIIESSERSLVANLVMASPEQLGVKFLKYSHRFEDWVSIYNHDEWKSLYCKYCEGTKTPPGREVLLKRISVYLLPLKVGYALDCVLRAILRVNGDFLLNWEKRHPVSFAFMQKIYRRLNE